jgi:2-methylcitrate dehydratase PrpD
LHLAPQPSEIASIRIETYGPGYDIVRNPRPATPYQSKFSIAYCVAAAILDGRCGLEQFSAARLADPAIAALLDCTEVHVAEDLTARYPAAWPCRLTIALLDGRVLRAAAGCPRGNPENPVSTAILEAKFRGLVEPHFGAAAAERWLATVRSLDTRSDMAEAFA